ncbi:PrsW family intramembrane metalloprotease [Haloarchaeobius sp. HME9146]|uniref:PrsW family intramembrane metalloprotease n=1 Tax=Haloarchaeobius sp. HME9146 TaxID=2978732 RepID=UPI0021BE9B91|nr:PrsW family glutamic-type intramembrane protease [Haloarchaeobius sp. HME9146]MCT9096620.1 PrsW family glutamic-type intramembrane protease [Haloarchaeobius sp. HME9146]
MTEGQDPIERVMGRSRDLYDIATWDERTLLDTVSVRLTGLLKMSSRLLLVFTAVLIIVAQLALTGFAVVRNPLLGGLTLLSVVPAALLVGYIWYDDPTLRQSLRSLVMTFVLGVLFAGFAAIVNTALSGLFGLIPVVGLALYFFLVVGPVEELVKWLAVRLYAFRSIEFHAVIDGAVYGAVAGLGFATIENAIYITRVYLEVASVGVNVVPSTINIASVRLLAGPGHVIYSAFAGYYLGLAKFNPENRGPIVVKGLLIAALVHGLYNTLVSYLPRVIPFGLPVFVAFILVYDGVLLTVLFRKLSRYQDAYHEALRIGDEAGGEAEGETERPSSA